MLINIRGTKEFVWTKDLLLDHHILGLPEVRHQDITTGGNNTLQQQSIIQLIKLQNFAFIPDQ